MKVRYCICLIFLPLLLLSGCISFPEGPAPHAPLHTRPAKDPSWLEETTKDHSAPNTVQLKIMEGAALLNGMAVPVLNGKTYNADCTGVVVAIYDYAGIDLSAVFPQYTGNGVSRIYQHMEKAGVVHNREIPEPGDIVFWDNTYDRNGDGEWNDLLTHIGIIINIGENGLLTYVHMHYTKGIIFEQMNLLKPDIFMEGDSVTNAAMRMKGEPDSPHWLSSHLFKAFASGWLLVK